jgi:hypothetical protein
MTSLIDSTLMPGLCSAMSPRVWMKNCTTAYMATDTAAPSMHVTHTWAKAGLSESMQ